jgi:hypothetical protein
MSPQVIIVSNEDELLLRQLIDELIRHDFTNLKLVQEQNALLNLINPYFKGFIIFCLPPDDLRHWMPFINGRLSNYFKIYYYNSLIEEDVSASMFLNFDYIIAGESKDAILSYQLDFLKSNYWRKIPLRHFGIEQTQISKLLKKIILTIEKTDINIVTLDHISASLNVSSETIRQELKDKLNINYSELKESLINYYRENYPDEFV